MGPHPDRIFTQEDPIGLAGGLNLYGFADGDPVSHSDPFGLCPPKDTNLDDCPTGTIDDITLLGAYRVLRAFGGEDALQTLVDHGIRVRLVGEERMALDCRDEKTSGCLRGKDMLLAGNRTSAELAVRIVHEATHVAGGWYPTEEVTAWNRALDFYENLPVRVPFYESEAQRRKQDPKAFNRLIFESAFEWWKRNQR